MNEAEIRADEPMGALVYRWTFLRASPEKKTLWRIQRGGGLMICGYVYPWKGQWQADCVHFGIMTALVESSDEAMRKVEAFNGIGRMSDPIMQDGLDLSDPDHPVWS